MVWIILLLASVIYVLAILCVEVIGRASTSTYPSGNAQEEVFIGEALEGFNNFLYFGTLYRSLVSLFSMVLLAEWATIVRPVNEAQPIMIGIFCVLVFITTFGFFNVIVGVVVERTTDAMAQARMDSEEVRVQKRLAMVVEMANIIFELDRDSDGQISLQELHAASNSDRFRKLMDGIELPHGFTFRELHEMFDHDRSNLLSKEEFVLGMLRLINCTPFQQACLQQSMLAQIKSQLVDLQSELNAFRVRFDMGQASASIAGPRPPRISRGGAPLEEASSPPPPDEASPAQPQISAPALPLITRGKLAEIAQALVPPLAELSAMARSETCGDGVKVLRDVLRVDCLSIPKISMATGPLIEPQTGLVIATPRASDISDENARGASRPQAVRACAVRSTPRRGAGEGAGQGSEPNVAKSDRLGASHGDCVPIIAELPGERSAETFV